MRVLAPYLYSVRPLLTPLTLILLLLFFTFTLRQQQAAADDDDRRICSRNQISTLPMQSISYMKQQQSNDVFLSIIFIILLLSATMKSSIQALSTKTTTLSTRKAIISSLPRIELFFSNTDELRKRITFLKSKGVSSFNIVNKSNVDDILQSSVWDRLGKVT